MAIDPTALAAFSAAAATRPSAPGAPWRAVAHDFRQTLADTLGQLDAPEGSAPRELPTRQSAHAAQAPEGVSAHQELVRLPGEPPEGIEGRVSRAGEPRQIRVALKYQF